MDKLASKIKEYARRRQGVVEEAGRQAAEPRREKTEEKEVGAKEVEVRVSVGVEDAANAEELRTKPNVDLEAILAEARAEARAEGRAEARAEATREREQLEVRIRQETTVAMEAAVEAERVRSEAASTATATALAAAAEIAAAERSALAAELTASQLRQQEATETVAKLQVDHLTALAVARAEGAADKAETHAERTSEHNADIDDRGGGDGDVLADMMSGLDALCHETDGDAGEKGEQEDETERLGDEKEEMVAAAAAAKEENDDTSSIPSTVSSSDEQPSSKELRGIFDAIDEDGNGLISLDELMAAQPLTGMTGAQTKEVYLQVRLLTLSALLCTVYCVCSVYLQICANTMELCTSMSSYVSVLRSNDIVSLSFFPDGC